MSKKIFWTLVVVIVIVIVGYFLFVRGLKIGLFSGNADVINVVFGEMTVEEFKTSCERDGGEYRERTFCGVACINYAECGYIKASDGNRLCYSSDREEKLFSNCGLCESGYRCGLAAGDFGPTHCNCAEYETLHRMTLEMN